MMDACVFCESSLDDGQAVVNLGAKGCQGITRASEALGKNLITEPGQRVHVECRKIYCNKKIIEDTLKRSHSTISDSSAAQVMPLRSGEPTFNFKEHCFFCGHIDTFDNKHQRGHKLIPVRAFVKKTIEQQCAIRNDKWSDQVMTRIGSVNDLPAVEAVYHLACNINFRNGKRIPLVFMSDADDEPVTKKRGHQHDTFQEEAFVQVMADLEQGDEEQTTINDLIDNMKIYLGDSDSTPYGFTYMKKMIKDHYGDNILITEINGKHNVVTFTTTASKILYDFHQHSEHNDEIEEKMILIKAAANLIKSDIRSIIQSKDNYPTTEDMNAENAIDFLPESLRTLLHVLFSGTKSAIKVASLGQAIIQTARPRVILCPLQLGLGVQLHHHFASRFLIDSLNHHGFCCSYSEVQCFERSASVSQGTDIHNLKADQVVQYAADNVDHNTVTIDGRGTFHGMGMIATVTPGTKRSYSVARNTVSTEEILSIGQVNIKYFKAAPQGISSLSYQPLALPDAEDSTSGIDALWKASHVLRPMRPGWSGLMQMVQKGNHPGQSSVLYLPMIDMNASDVSCVYSTLNYVSSHAKRHDVTPILTFDQPLWWKAFQIRESEPEDSDLHSIVLRLGGFHTIMSFLGSIGHIMAGSGLEDVLEQLFAGNVVSHILSGKAVERATRGHSLVNATLNAMLVSKAFHTDMSAINQFHDLKSSEQTCFTEHIHQSARVDNGPQDDKDGQPSTCTTDVDIHNHKLLEQLAGIYDDVTAGSLPIADLQTSPQIQQFSDSLLAMKNSLHASKNSNLWLQYMDMMDILRTFIKSERMGIWNLQLQAMHDMLPYLAASGHNLYTKSVYIYLQDMMKLEVLHPAVYTHFMQGYHVVRRSNRFWAGISVDLAIEQILMKSVKSTGGLTRGRGMSEIQRLVWLMSRPTCLEINNTMQEFSSVSYSTSEQHKEATPARIERDMKDTNVLMTYLTDRSPFSTDLTLHNITTGVTAEDRVTAHRAKAVGMTIVEAMVGKQVMEHSFKKKDQIVTMASTNSAKIRDEFISIDPQLLFQRLMYQQELVMNNFQTYSSTSCQAILLPYLT